MAHQHLGLTDIQEHAGIGDMFDTVVVFENYPVDAAASPQRRAGCVSAASMGTMPHTIR